MVGVHSSCLIRRTALTGLEEETIVIHAEPYDGYQVP